MNTPQNYSLRFTFKKLFSLKLFFSFFLLLNHSANSQNSVSKENKINNFNDSYAQAVSAIEAGILDIDYKKLRENFIKSDQFKITYRSRSKMSNLKRQFYENKFHSRTHNIIRLSKEILELDYTDMSIHQVLEEAYNKINDTENENKHRTIKNGLLDSIMKDRDGISCQTSWSIVNVSEQYFILDLLNSTVVKQETNTDNDVCYKTTVAENGIEKTYYFDATKLLEAHKKIRTF